MLFNFMTPINAEIEITTARRKILAQKYCTKNDPNSRTLQNVFRSLEKSGLLLKKERNKHTTIYVVPLISATRSLYNVKFRLFNLLHETQTEAIQLGLKRKDLNVDPQKIKQKISEQMTEELVGKISYKSEKVRVKVTYELECDSVSGEVSYGNLVDVIDVKPIEKSPSSIQNSSIIEEFIQTGNSLKKNNKLKYGIKIISNFSPKSIKMIQFPLNVR